MINVKRLKQTLTADQIILIMCSLDIAMKKQTGEHIIFESRCCKSDYKNRSAKLYYYIQTQSFFCYSCNFSGDIITLVQRIDKCSFIKALWYVCDCVGIDPQLYERQAPKYNYNWQGYYSQFLYEQKTEQELVVYDDSILSFFEDKYYQGWIDYGLSEKTLEHFEIKWYDFQKQIVIPVRDGNDNLIGIRARNTIDGAKYIPLQLLDGSCYKFPTNMILFGEKQNESYIKESKTVWLVEGEKSVLKAAEWFGINNNPALAMFGGNLSECNRKYLLRLGVKEVVLFADRDFDSVNSLEYQIWERKIKKIESQLKNFCSFRVVWDKEFRLNKKDNLFDGTKNYLKEMLKVGE